ncbi:hypothetical protein L0F63_006282, partial [Massospora cicadina]
MGGQVALEGVFGLLVAGADVDFAMEEDNKYMRLAIEQANRCTPTAGAYSVGAVLVNAGQVISVGYSREL